MEKESTTNQFESKIATLRAKRKVGGALKITLRTKT
jgi:hypothetical protein